MMEHRLFVLPHKTILSRVVFFWLYGFSFCGYGALVLILSLWDRVPHARVYKSVALDLGPGEDRVCAK
jgi:hypothetical protein